MNWKCGVCNLVIQGEGPPDPCPKCGAAGTSYKQLEQEQVELMTRSRLTNDLYMEILSLIPRLEELARQGVADDLDPRCVAIHQRMLADLDFWGRSIRAEIEGHVGKGKWG